ncbi:MAG TPA: hypothetical protein VFG10_09320 [Saprospiraceae bacterium]|nr:hypothetical protein [Saprospiraceae bacterium]
MDSLIVHEIIAEDLYQLNRPDTIVVYGREIRDNIIHTRLFEDTIIALDPTLYYKYVGKSDTLFFSGQNILDAFPLKEFQPLTPVMCWGAFFIGLVLGWNLYFINRHRAKSGVGIGDIATISTALMTAVIFSFFGSSLELLGWYGTGVGVGFLLYGLLFFLLVIFYYKKGDPLPLRFLTWPLYWTTEKNIKDARDE